MPLFADAERDLKALDWPFRKLPLHSTEGATYDDLDFGDGVLYTTYANLKSKRGNRSKSSFDHSDRVSQVVAWCGGADFEGVIAFDEVHRAKNLVGAIHAEKRTDQM